MAQNLTKAQRREAARKEAERLAAKQAAADKRSRTILIGVLVVVVLAIAVAGYFIYKESQKTLLTDFDGEVPAGADLHGGIAVGPGAVAGTTSSDAPTVDMYLDFICPACGSFEEVNGEDVTEMLEAGEFTMVYHPLGFLDGQSQGTEFSSRSANAFATVATDDPENAVPFLMAMFENQPGEQTEGLTDDEISDIAIDAGVNPDVAATFGAGTYRDWVAAATDQASRDGVSSTPTIMLNGEEQGKDQLNWSQPGAFRELVEGSDSGSGIAG